MILKLLYVLLLKVDLLVEYVDLLLKFTRSILVYFVLEFVLGELVHARPVR
jgi:hypothetical protein